MATPRQNVGNLTLVRGGRYAARCVAAEIAVERYVRERFAALRREDGTALRDKTVYNVAEGVTVPTRKTTKLLQRLKRLRVSRALARELVIEPQEQAFRAVYGGTGEHRPAA